MTREEELAERARRHGLHREETRNVCGWGRPASGVFVVGRDDAGRWWWVPEDTTWSAVATAPRYKTEATALAAALDWLDEQEPSKAWRQSPGAKLGEAVHWVKLARQSIPVASGTTLYLDRALATLESIALPPASDEGAVLEVALDYLLSLGKLTEGARQSIVALLRERPEMADAAKVVGPLEHDESATAMTVLRCYTLHGLAGEVGHDEDNDRWWWKLGRAVDFMVLQWVPTKELATSRLAAALRDRGYVLCPATPPAPPAPEAETAPGDTRGEACAACDGSGWLPQSPAGRINCPVCQPYEGTGRGT